MYAAFCVLNGYKIAIAILLAITDDAFGMMECITNTYSII